MKLADFTRIQIKRIVEAYVSSPIDVTGAMYAEKYDISITMFHKILRKAVVESIVSLETVKKIISKSSQNAYQHGGKAAEARVRNAYERYLNERKFFEFKEQDKIFYSKKYAESSLTQEEFCKLYCMPKKLFGKTIRSAIEDVLIDADTVALIKEKAIRNNGKETVIPFFDTLLRKRLENAELKMIADKEKQDEKKKKRKQKKVHNATTNNEKQQREMIEFQQETLEDYGICDELYLNDRDDEN